MEYICISKGNVIDVMVNKGNCLVERFDKDLVRNFLIPDESLKSVLQRLNLDTSTDEELNNLKYNLFYAYFKAL